MNYWMFAMISIGCIFIVFVGVSIYILWYSSSTIFSDITHQQVKCQRQEEKRCLGQLKYHCLWVLHGQWCLYSRGIGIAGSKKLKGECNGYNFLKCCDVSLQVCQKGTFLNIVF